MGRRAAAQLSGRLSRFGARLSTHILGGTFVSVESGIRAYQEAVQTVMRVYESQARGRAGRTLRRLVPRQ
jgi:hypothetical protein